MSEAKYFDRILLIVALILTFYSGSATFGQEEEFVIIALPDTQKYVLNGAYPEIFTAQTQWIANNASSMNIVFVVHEGDIVDTWNNTTEWNYANNSMSVLDPVVPYSVVPGDHDHCGEDPPGSTWYYEQYFPASRFNGRPWWGESYAGNYGGDYNEDYEHTNNNNYQLLTIGGQGFIFLSLDFCPSQDEINWANGILTAYPERMAILTTHALLDTSANYYGSSDFWLYPDGSSNPSGDTSRIWYDLIRNHENLQLVLCGHMHGESRRTDYNLAGKPVHQLLANYQDRTNGGNGWLRIMRFVPTEDTVYVKTYSPSLGQYETDGDSEFSLHLVMGDVDDVNNVANSDIAVKGTISGDYTDTQISDNVYETITERLSGGKPSNRYSYLEHKWTFNVIGGATVTFNVEAYKTADGDGDNFILAYSTDDNIYNDLVTVWKTSDDNTVQSCPLPASITGTVYIRIKDTDQITGSQSLDSIHIDRMYIKSAGESEPDLEAPTPNPMTWEIVPNATGTTSISMTATTASDPSGVEYKFYCVSSGGHDSNWQDSPYYEDTGLSPATEYGYIVTARDKSPNQNETGWSEAAYDSTMSEVGDLLTITKAEYRLSNSELNVEATSVSGGEAELRVYDSSFVVEYGVMTYDSKKDIYKLKIRGASDPGGLVWVSSSFDALESKEVTSK